MLTKIPLGGVKCLACDKVINNYHGHVPDYKPWKKLPKDIERSTKVRINNFDRFIVRARILESVTENEKR